jgi:hypothetical protein
LSDEENRNLNGLVEYAIDNKKQRPGCAAVIALREAFSGRRAKSPRGEEARPARARERSGGRSRPHPVEPIAGGEARSRSSGSDVW